MLLAHHRGSPRIGLSWPPHICRNAPRFSTYCAPLNLSVPDEERHREGNEIQVCDFTSGNVTLLSGNVALPRGIVDGFFLHLLPFSSIFLLSQESFPTPTICCLISSAYIDSLFLVKASALGMALAFLKSLERRGNGTRFNWEEAS